MSHHTWLALPALRHALWIALGIVLADFTAVDRGTTALILACSLATLVSTIVLSPGITRRAFGGLATAAVVAAAGLALRSMDQLDRQLPPRIAIRDADAVGAIADEPRLRHGQLEFTMDVDSVLLRSSVARCRRRVIVRIRAWQSRFNLPAIGARVAVVGALRSPRPPRYPGDLDEAAWLATSGVDLVLDARGSSALVVASAAPNTGVDAVLLALRRHFRSYAEDRIGGQEGAIVRALLVGERDGIDADVRDAYARTGTIHVLSVSGLHVSLIAAGLGVFVTWFASRWVRLFAFVLLLGLYAVVAGAAPSIVRAWVMASALMLGSVAGRETTTLNLLGVAALLILVCSPGQLYSPGFQLSFGAVAGIGLLYRRLLHWIGERMPLLQAFPPLRWITSGLAVTLAAQLPTVPLLLLHFGTIPLAGLALNLVVVPLTSVALGAALAGSLFFAVPFVADLYATTAQVSVGAATAIVRIGAQLPLATMGPWWVPWPAILTLGAIIVFAIAARSVRSALLRLALAAVATWAVSIVSSSSDPLALRAGRAVYLLPGALETVVAVQRGHSLTGFVRSSDSSGVVAGMLARLARRVGASELHLTDLRNDSAARSHGVLRVGRRTWLMADPAMVLTGARGRTTGVVRLGDRTHFQVALRQRPLRAYVLHDYHHWKRVQWH